MTTYSRVILNICQFSQYFLRILEKSSISWECQFWYNDLMICLNEQNGKLQGEASYLCRSAHLTVYLYAPQIVFILFTGNLSVLAVFQLFPYNGHLFVLLCRNSYYNGGFPRILVADLDMLRDILIKDAHNFVNRPVSISEMLLLRWKIKMMIAHAYINNGIVLLLIIQIKYNDR